MALDNDELNKRRKERELQRKKRQAEQRKLRLRLVFVAVALIACIVGIVILTGGKAGAPGETTPPETTVPETTAAPTEAPGRTVQETTKVIHIKAAGDLNITDSVVNSADTDLGYDYTRPFMDVAPILADADLTLLNLEGNICGAPYGTASVSAPEELLDALVWSGVDMVQMANSYSVYNGMIGLSQTLDNIRKAGLEPLGAYSSENEFRKGKGYTIVDIQGVKIAFVAFTKGMGSLGLPAGSENCVNVLYTDYSTTYRDVDDEKITSILKKAQSEKPDLTIALLHWGSEYNDALSETQEEILNLMKKNGVDAIIGTHPHMVHQMEYENETGFFIAYSLGDFFGNATKGGSNYSIILDLEITKDLETGVTKVTDYSYTPIYTLTESETADGHRRVVRIREAMAAYDVNFVDKVTASAYAGMQNALERIADRVVPKVTEKK